MAEAIQLQTTGAKESEQSWPRQFRPGCITYREIFLKEESPSRIGERSIVNFFKLLDIEL